ncbi:MAG TPA: AI-2E family transporter [Bryobacteraceae bacterium]|nr:AI-2E family transporter [Bryobacteraceae bacterium]
MALIAAALLPFAWRIAEPFFTALLLAVILAVLLEPVHLWLARKLGRPGPAALLTAALAGLLVSVALWTVGAVLAQQVGAAYISLAQPSANDSWTTGISRAAGRIAEVVASRIPVDSAVVRSELLRYADGSAAWLLRAVGSVLSRASAALVTMLLMLIFLNELLRHGRGWIDRALPALPLDAGTVERLIRNIQSTIVGVVGGTFVAAVSEAVLTGTAFAFASVPSAAMLGFFCGLASIVPLVGCSLVWAPVVIYELATGAYAKAAAIGIWCGVATVVIDNVVRPAVARGHVQMHSLTIALSIIGGTRAFGALGIILGPLIISLLLAVLLEVRRIAADARNAPTSMTQPNASRV